MLSCFRCFSLVAVQEYIKCVELGRAASAKISEFSRTSIERCQVRAYVCTLVLISPVQVMMFIIATKQRRYVHNRLLSLLVLRCLIIFLSYIHFTRSRHVPQVVLICWQIDVLHTVWGYGILGWLEFSYVNFILICFSCWWTFRMQSCWHHKQPLMLAASAANIHLKYLCCCNSQAA